MYPKTAHEKQRLMHEALDAAILNYHIEAPLDIIAQPDFNPRYIFLSKAPNPRRPDLYKPVLPSHLHLAAWHGHADIVGALIAKGADVNGLTGGGTTPLHSAIFRRRTSIIDLLLKNGAKVRKRHLHSAAATSDVPDACHLTMSTLLLDANSAGINSTINDQLMTPLMLTARLGYIDTVRLYMSRGANPFMKDKHRLTARLTARQIAFNYVRLDVAQFLEAEETRIKEEKHTRRQRLIDAFIESHVILQKDLVIEYPLKRKPRGLTR